MLMMRAFYMLRRLEFEKRKMRKTEVIWEGKRTSIDVVIEKLRKLAEQEVREEVFVQARVRPTEPSSTELTEFSDVQIEYL